MSNEVETAFLIIRHPDGSYSAKTDITDTPEITRKPNIYDIKHGCAEILDTIKLQAVQSVVGSVMTEVSSTEGQKVASAVRQSLVDKGLL